MSLPARLIKNPADFGKVAVLMGGWSAEREISLRSGTAVLEALVAAGVDAHKMDPRDDFQGALLDRGFDRVFIMLHGRGGEDGTVQGALEFLRIPYTGSGVLGSAIGMDKLRSKQVFQAAGLATPAFRTLATGANPQTAAAGLKLPLAVKPAHEGSSIGLTKVTETDQLTAAVAEARRQDTTVLIEEWIEGRECTVAILCDMPLPLIRIETPREFYDYTAKYESDQTLYHCPSGLNPALEQRLLEQSLQAFRAVGARGWGRVDLLLDSQDQAYFLEINTVPGMTSHSLVPQAARVAGCDFTELVLRILETSFDQAVGNA